MITTEQRLDPLAEKLVRVEKSLRRAVVEWYQHQDLERGMKLLAKNYRHSAKKPDKRMSRWETRVRVLAVKHLQHHWSRGRIWNPEMFLEDAEDYREVKVRDIFYLKRMLPEVLLEKQQQTQFPVQELVVAFMNAKGSSLPNVLLAWQERTYDLARESYDRSIAAGTEWTPNVFLTEAKSATGKNVAFIAELVEVLDKFVVDQDIDIVDADYFRSRGWVKAPEPRQWLKEISIWYLLLDELEAGGYIPKKTRSRWSENMLDKHGKQIRLNGAPDVQKMAKSLPTNLHELVLKNQ